MVASVAIYSRVKSAVVCLRCTRVRVLRVSGAHRAPGRTPWPAGRTLRALPVPWLGWHQNRNTYHPLPWPLVQRGGFLSPLPRPQITSPRTHQHASF